MNKKQSAKQTLAIVFAIVGMLFLNQYNNWQTLLGLFFILWANNISLTTTIKDSIN